MLNSAVVRSLSFHKGSDETELRGEGEEDEEDDVPLNQSGKLWAVEYAEPSAAELIFRKNLGGSSARSLSVGVYLWSCAPAEDWGEVQSVISRFDALLVTALIGMCTASPVFALHIPVCLAPDLNEKGIAPHTIGLLLATSHAVGIFAAPLSAYLINNNKGGANKPLALKIVSVSVLLTSAGAALFAYGMRGDKMDVDTGSRYLMLFISRVLTGAGYFTLEPCMAGMLARWTGRQPHMLSAMLFVSDFLQYLLAAVTFTALPSVASRQNLPHALWGAFWLPSFVSVAGIILYHLYCRVHKAHLYRDTSSVDGTLESLGLNHKPRIKKLPPQLWFQLIAIFFTYSALPALANFFPLIIHKCAIVGNEAAGRFGACVYVAAGFCCILIKGLDSMPHKVSLQGGLSLASVGIVLSFTQKRVWGNQATMAIVLVSAGILLRVMQGVSVVSLNLLVPTGWDSMGYILYNTFKHMGAMFLFIIMTLSIDKDIDNMDDTQSGLLPLMIFLGIGVLSSIIVACWDKHSSGLIHLNCDDAIIEKERREKESGHVNPCPTICVKRTQRASWEADSKAISCKLCTSKFSFSTRRHHCRACGGVFCRNCTAHRVPLPQYGIACLMRVCSTCYVRFAEERNAAQATNKTSSNEQRKTSDGTGSFLQNRTITGESMEENLHHEYACSLRCRQCDPMSRLPMSQFIEFEELKDDSWVEIAHGAFGRVYRCEFDRVLEQVAVKELRDQRTNPKDKDEQLQAFVDEICCLNHLRYEHILTFYGWSRNEDKIYMVTALCVGKLSTKLAGPFPISEYLDIALRIARALLFIHSEGVVHQDVASRNILLTTSGDAKLADLGLCAPVGSAAPVVPVLWSPPEALSIPNSQRRAANSFDVWSFGVLLWEMLSVPLQCPYFWLLPETDFDRSKFLQKAKSQIVACSLLPKPPGRSYATVVWDNVITKCWVISPTERPTMREVVDSLRNLLDKVPEMEIDKNDEQPSSSGSSGYPTAAGEAFGHYSAPTECYYED
eukprot:TRINITY_DN6347_c0_g1_i2.p1 TRINITY_DN6347_c0_g1~~TRINITY_DN6347_c0_g1_i2.p1  ORF type:complete len:1011 (+),score=143.98 TRINITY_DN6347_c0_g1_i2:103-3135(+)